MPAETETPPPAAAESSPLADALVDFNALGGAPPEVKSEAPDDGTSFLEEFNKEVEQPAAETPATEEPVEPEAPAAETPDDIDEIQAPEKASPAAKESFQKIKDSAKSYKQKLDAAEKLRVEELSARDTRIAELEERMAAMPELSEKAKFAEEAERELAISRVEATREYKTTIDAPLRAIEDAALAVAKANEVDGDAILDAITEPDPAKRRELLKSVIAHLDDVEKQEVISMARDTQELLRKREDIRSRASEARKEQEERAHASDTLAKKKAREDFSRETENTVSELRKRMPFAPLADGETADNVFKGLLERAKSTDFDSASVGNKAFAAAAAIALPRMIRQYAELEKVNKTYLARIAEGNKSRATVTETTSPATTDGDDFFGNMGIADPGAGIKALR